VAFCNKWFSLLPSVPEKISFDIHHQYWNTRGQLFQKDLYGFVLPVPVAPAIKYDGSKFFKCYFFTFLLLQLLHYKMAAPGTMLFSFR
jgi:hypothetical protein